MDTQHVSDHAEHVSELSRRLHELRAAHARLGAPDHFEELFQIIHSPGFTTPTEIFLMNALVDSAESSMQDARRLHGALLDGARAISEASAG
jgi:hypothetical protein